MPRYSLSIQFLSNERPWNGTHEACPWGPVKDDASAIEWAWHMQHGLGNTYKVTLLRDDEVLPYE